MILLLLFALFCFSSGFAGYLIAEEVRNWQKKKQK